MRSPAIHVAVLLNRGYLHQLGTPIVVVAAVMLVSAVLLLGVNVVVTTLLLGGLGVVVLQYGKEAA